MWIVWLFIGTALISAEMLIGDLVLFLLGAAALTAGFAAWLDLGLAWQLGTFVVFSLFFLGTVRPVVNRLLHRGDRAGARTGMAAMIGRLGTVTSEPLVGDGIVRIRVGSEEWRAAPTEPGTLYAGDQVRILGFEGATLLVEAESVHTLAPAA